MNDEGRLSILRLPIMVNVELGDGVGRQVHFRSLLDVKLEHVCFLESDGGLDKLPTVHLHIDLIDELANDLYAAHIG